VFTDLLLPHIQRGCEHSGGRFTPEGCIKRWIDGKWTMWAVNDPENNCVAVGFVQINEYPDTGLRCVEVVLLGGTKIHAWKHLEPLLLDHARHMNCERIEAFGRGPLKSILPHWRHGVLIERDVP
jgi:hypothetical protein